MILQARCAPRHGKDGAGCRAETWSPGVRCINASGTEPAPLTFVARLSSGSKLRGRTQHACSDGCVRNSCKAELRAPALLLRDTSGLEAGQGTSLKACSMPEWLRAPTWDGLGARGSSCTPCCQNRNAMRCPSALLLQPYLHPSLVPGAGSPSQGMGSHWCWEPGLSHTPELRTGARVQGLRESPHPQVAALTVGRAAVAPETQVSCKSPATTRSGGLRAGCRSMLSAA